MSQRDAAALFGGPIAGVVDLDGLERQREAGERLSSGRDTLHEVLDFLQVAAGPFLLETDILPAGFAIDLFGDVDARELLLRGLVAHQMCVRGDVGEQRTARGVGLDQIAHAAHDHVAGEHRALGADRKSTRLNSSHLRRSRMPSSA